jgi:predicted nucleotidyltransferase component of viral defense system
LNGRVGKPATVPLVHAMLREVIADAESAVSVVDISVKDSFYDLTLPLINHKITKRGAFFIHAALMLQPVPERYGTAAEMAVLRDLRVVGVDKRSTMDIDTTVKGLPVNREEIEKILREIIAVRVDDGVAFEIRSIKNIHDISEYDDYRVSISAAFLSITVSMSIDITTGDSIIPREIEYNYKLMFEDRVIPVMAYNLNTILAEKIETILTRGIGNTRGRDYYDAYLLISLNKNTLSRADLLHAIQTKADERGSIPAIENHVKILNDIAASPDIAKIWSSYSKRYHYAKGIVLPDIIALITWVFE